MSTTQPFKPWYREPWPWILMSGPGAVIVAGAITLVIAMPSNDGVVADDYYKRGLEVNQVLRRAHEASAAGLVAELSLRGSRVLVSLPGAADDELILTLVHPTRGGEDRTVRLAREGDGFAGSLQATLYGARRIVLEDTRNRWRIEGRLEPGAHTARLSAAL